MPSPQAHAAADGKDQLPPGSDRQPVKSSEEPEISSESDIPSDGRDTVGERMIRQLDVSTPSDLSPQE